MLQPCGIEFLSKIGLLRLVFGHLLMFLWIRLSVRYSGRLLKPIFDEIVDFWPPTWTPKRSKMGCVLWSAPFFFLVFGPLGAFGRLLAVRQGHFGRYLASLGSRFGVELRLPWLY